MRKTAEQIADEVLKKVALFGSEKRHYKNVASRGESSIKKEYMRLRDLAVTHPKPGNTRKFRRFKEEIAKSGKKYPTAKWEKEEPRTLTALTGIR